MRAAVERGEASPPGAIAAAASSSAAPAVPAPPSHPPPDTPTCRICWDVADTATPGGRLISPCACKGTAAHVHVSCLAAWVHLPGQASGGGAARARVAVGRGAGGPGLNLHVLLFGGGGLGGVPLPGRGGRAARRANCELCGSKFRLPRGVGPEDRELFERGPPREGGGVGGSGRGRRPRNPVTALRSLPWAAWRVAAARAAAALAADIAADPVDATRAAWVVALGARAAVGAVGGAASGAAAGARLGASSSRRVAAVLDFAPDAALAGWAVPWLQRPIAAAGTALVLVWVAQLAVPVAGGAYLGAAAGVGASLARDAASHAHGLAAVGRGVARLVGAVLGRRRRRVAVG